MTTTGEPKKNYHGYQCEPESFTVVYLDDGYDLRDLSFTHLEDCRKFIESDIADYKAIIVEGRKLEDHT